MVTIKEYASVRNISYEAVRQSIKRHSAELGDHIFKQGRTTCLDDQAVEILDNYRVTRAVKISAQEVTEQNEYIDQLKDQIMQLQNRVIELEKDQNKAIEAKVRYELLTEKASAQEEQIGALQAEASEYHDKLILKEAEAKDLLVKWNMAERVNTALHNELRENKMHPWKTLFATLRGKN